MNMKTPCKDCYPPKRKMYCHSYCAEYIAFQKANDEKNRKEDAENDAKYTRHPVKERALRRKMRWK